MIESKINAIFDCGPRIASKKTYNKVKSVGVWVESNQLFNLRSEEHSSFSEAGYREQSHCQKNNVIIIIKILRMELLMIEATINFKCLSIH